MARFKKVEALADGWSEWQQPIRRGYKMACCDCGLVHTMDFRIHKGHIQFRARRNNRSTALMRRPRTPSTGRPATPSDQKTALG